MLESVIGSTKLLICAILSLFISLRVANKMTIQAVGNGLRSGKPFWCQYG